MLLSVHINSTTTKTSFDQVTLSRASLLSSKGKHRMYFFFSFNKFQWGSKLWPRKWNIPTPVKALSLGDITVSNRGVKSCALQGQERAGFILTISEPEAVCTKLSSTSGEIHKDHSAVRLSARTVKVLWNILVKSEKEDVYWSVNLLKEVRKGCRANRKVHQPLRAWSHKRPTG